MGIKRIGPQLTLHEQAARRPENRGRILAVESMTPNGHILRARELMVVGKALPGHKVMNEVELSRLVDEKREIVAPKMAAIPIGMFEMGSEKFEGEMPVRSITILRPFEISENKVAIREYCIYLVKTRQDIPNFMSEKDLDLFPAVHMSWYDATSYCKWLSELTGCEYGLPTEAEWEYAARGRFRFGLMDMTGNIWEWVADWFGGYAPQDLIDPVGPRNGDNRVLRGGSTRITARDGNPPGVSSFDIGFRIIKRS